MKLEPIDAAVASALLAGDLGGRATAVGWPTPDSPQGLSFAGAGGLGFLVIDDDGLVAGECGTKGPPDRDGRVEIGYGLAAGSRGRGLGGRAVAELLRQLAARDDIRVVEAEVHVSNAPSRRIVERLGLEEYAGPVGGFVRYRLVLGRAPHD